LWAIAGAAALGELAGLPFLLSLPAFGVTYVLARSRRRVAAAMIVAIVVGVSLLLVAGYIPAADPVLQPESWSAGDPPSLGRLFASGLRSGLLTFGGAYTVIPFLQNDAVGARGWMTNDQFLDGLALSGLLPAPLIIFATFVGYVGGGPAGALALTTGIFLPAFAFPLLAHAPLERLVMRPALHAFLIGVTACVVGLIAVSAIVLARAAVIDGWTLAIAAGVLLLLYRSHARLAVLAAVIGGGLVGWLVQSVVTRS
jgi:chromate transporter